MLRAGRTIILLLLAMSFVTKFTPGSPPPTSPFQKPEKASKDEDLIFDPHNLSFEQSSRLEVWIGFGDGYQFSIDEQEVHRGKRSLKVKYSSSTPHDGGGGRFATFSNFLPIQAVRGIP